MLIAGAISGTSLDGIDVALCDVGARGDGVRVRCERFATVRFRDDLRARILAAYPPAPIGALEVSALHAAVGEAFGDAIRSVAGATSLDAVASHGLTLAHDGPAHHTLQIGDPFRIRERVAATVVYDFRSADTAAGGSGAPLVPFVDRLLFGERAPCVALNLGGIANMTVLPEGIAFDSGPANLPIDTYVALRSDGALRFDRDGSLARSGSVDMRLLTELLDDPYFRALPPKTTGREEYGAPYVAARRDRLDALPFADAVATLTALTVRSVADAFWTMAPRATLLIVSGGGARNPALVEGLRTVLPGVEVTLSDAFGVDADAKEAIAFAVLGYTTLRGRTAGLPRVTGARGERVLGAIAPYELDALLRRIAAEAGPRRPYERIGAPRGEAARMICVGVDAGGSSTIAVTSDDGVYRRDARGPGANPTTLGVDDAADVIITTIRDALAGGHPAAIHVGVAGAGRARVAEHLRGLIGTAFRGARVTVGDDVAIALRAAIPEGDGAVLIAGTGSTAYAEHGARSQRVGGLGYLAGDEGSAFWIGMQAVKLYGRALDGRAPADETTELVARALEAPDRERYLDVLYDAPTKPARIAALAPSILAFAGKGNRASTKIVQQAAQELGDLLKSALRAVELLDATPRIALAGGLFAENSLLTFLLETRLNGDVAGAAIVKAGDEPARGALRLAERRSR